MAGLRENPPSVAATRLACTGLMATRFSKTGLGLTMCSPGQESFCMLKVLMVLCLGGGGAFCHWPRLRERKGNLARRCDLGDIA